MTLAKWWCEQKNKIAGLPPGTHRLDNLFFGGLRLQRLGGFGERARSYGILGKKGVPTKAADHYGKAESLQQQQEALDTTRMPDAIIMLCHGAAHHFVCAGLEWLGSDPQSYGHLHSKHPGHLKQVGAPASVLEAWQQIERLRSRALYGGETTTSEAAIARDYLATIQAGAQGLRP